MLFFVFSSQGTRGNAEGGGVGGRGAGDGEAMREKLNLGMDITYFHNLGVAVSFDPIHVQPSVLRVLKKSNQ